MSLETVGGLPHAVNNIIIWILPRYELPLQEGIRVWSEEFEFRYKKNLNSVYKNERIPDGWIGLICENYYNYDTQVNASYRFGVVDSKNAVINCCDGKWVQIVGVNGYFIVSKLFHKGYMVNRQHLRVRKLRIFCEAINKKDVNSPKEIENMSAAASNISSVSTSISTNSETCNSKSISRSSSKSHDTFQSTGNEIPASNEEKEVTRSEHTSSKADGVRSQYMKNLEKLSQNFEELYISGQDSDLTINVKKHEFKAHKVILRARSSAFNAMFSHELSESNSNIIPIEDCEPAVFEEFLCFVYSGRTRQISAENACKLYYVADKYLVPELKEECIHFLKKSLAIETICDVICLSTKCKEIELLDLAVKFFARNMEEILLTVKWQLFMKENPTEANELTIKTLRFGFTKKENLN